VTTTTTAGAAPGAPAPAEGLPRTGGSSGPVVVGAGTLAASALLFAARRKLV
jgi:LPXTG-motif cell wall-anchored protein